MANHESDRPRDVSRRRFLTQTAIGSAGLWIEVAIPRPLAAEAMARPHSEPAGGAESLLPTTRHALNPLEWKTVEAMTGRILPADETPGAIEAGCVRFIDRALAHEDASARPLYQKALAALEAVSQGRTGASFYTASTAEQDALLRELESGEVSGWTAADARPAAFFATLRMHTLLGFVLDPSYGGNRDYVGWKTMGFPGPVHHLGGSQADQMRGEREFIPVWERNGKGHP